MTATEPLAQPLRLDPILAAFQPFEAASGLPSWALSIRKAGLAHFSELGFPTVRHEEWKYTNVAAIAKMPFLPAPRPVTGVVRLEHLAAFRFPDLDAIRLVLVNGHFAPELSALEGLPPGVRVSSLAGEVAADNPLVRRHLARYNRYQDNAFAALNTAFFADGVFIHLSAGANLERPVHLLCLTAGSGPAMMSLPRVLIIAEPGSNGRILEHFVGLAGAAGVTNTVTEVVLGEGAQLEHCKIQDETIQTSHLASLDFYQARNSRLLSHSISLGALLARNNLTPVLDGEGIDTILNGLYLAKGDQLVDHHTAIHHAKPNCGSHEFYHGVLDGRAQGVFNGKIFVRPLAQKTDAKQTNRNLLLSDEATINTKPQLEIFADDVKCTHGATVGQLDEEALFYLRSRGIGCDAARNMLIHAFAGGILDRITLEPVRRTLDQRLFQWFEQKAADGPVPTP